jgi:hypothetical protein
MSEHKHAPEPHMIEGEAEANAALIARAPDLLAENERLRAERDQAWCELRIIRTIVEADAEESTADEVARLRAENEQLQRQVEFQRASVHKVNSPTETKT